MLDVANPFDDVGLREIRAEEARLLKARAGGSARMLMVVVLLAALLLLLSGRFSLAVLWLSGTSAMVGVTLLYARFVQPEGITQESADRYLNGHALVTACTGLVWSSFAIFIAMTEGLLGAFIAGLFLTGLTTGGAMAGTVYRPAYLALLFCSIGPFTIALLVQPDVITKVYGCFMLAYIAFCYITNEQASRRTRETIVSSLGRDAAEQIIEQAAEIDRLNEQRARFMASISHDMAQPIIAQRHFLRQLRDAGIAPEQHILLERIETVQSSQERLLQDLIGFSHLSQKSLSVSPVLFEISALFEQVDAEFARPTAQAQQSLTFEPTDISLFADRHFLHRILRNLITNANKYAGPDAAIRLSAIQNEDQLQIEVSDTGLGIAAADTARAFDEYVRLSKGDEPGLGLGLAISQRLADAMDGSIEMSSTPGDGVTIRIGLPMRAAPSAMPGTTPLILIIGPVHRPDIGSWSELISGWMWQFLCAGSLDEALALVEQTGLTPDIVILDEDLPTDARIQKFKVLQIGDDAGLLPPLNPEAIRQTLVRALR
ncbi:sensor histidine kinase [Pontivivens insulae]|uniref:histidine kinase n=1 Tax=Pontivivens insulae TaxID=1639689 RepID=A0A2R8A9X0_9RHOB|nr:HAMP domain-containing sensor histidine kinase [Pontivivens insulae]RED12953.1 signal transduction histidine kinase [Pontivivens insulae]SPF29046.1 Alkaline phosphatase synthesis sensor protein PhoR [Pontivivens insulae]